MYKSIIIFMCVNLFLLASNLPKVFSELGDGVYTFMPTCQELEKLQSPLGHSCQLYNLDAKESMKRGFLLDTATRERKKLKPKRLKAYTYSIRKLLKKKQSLSTMIKKSYDKALQKKDEALLSVFYTLTGYKQHKDIDKTIASLGVTLRGKALKQQQVYQEKIQALKQKSIAAKKARKERSKRKKAAIASKKYKRLRALTCIALQGRPAMKGEIGMIKGMVVGRNKQGYIIENAEGIRFFLQKYNLDTKYKVLDKVGFHAVGARIARKIRYAYSDSVDYVVRKSEMIPFITYKGELKKICKD